MPPNSSLINNNSNTASIHINQQQNQHPQAVQNNGKITISNLNQHGGHNNNNQVQHLQSSPAIPPHHQPTTTTTQPPATPSPQPPSSKSDLSTLISQQIQASSSLSSSSSSTTSSSTANSLLTPQTQQQSINNNNHGPMMTAAAAAMASGNMHDIKTNDHPMMSHVPMPAMGGGKPSVMGLMPQFEDPVEQSLASLEQPTPQQHQQQHQQQQQPSLKLNMDLITEMSSLISNKGSMTAAAAAQSADGHLSTSHHNLLQQLSFDGMQPMQQQQQNQQLHHSHYPHYRSLVGDIGAGIGGMASLGGLDNNGFNLDASMAAMNGMTGVMPPMQSNRLLQQHDAMYAMMMQRQDEHSLLTAGVNDERNILMSNSGMSITAIPPVITTAADTAGSINVKKEEKFMLTPKPIEELMMPSHDKKMISDGKGGHGGHNTAGSGPPASVFAFNSFSKSHDNNLKNASSWSSLAAAGSPQNPSTVGNKSKPPAMDSFQQFRNKAKEKADRQKLLQQQEMRQKEALEKRQQEQMMQQQKHHGHKSRSGAGGGSSTASIATGRNDSSVVVSGNNAVLNTSSGGAVGVTGSTSVGSIIPGTTGTNSGIVEDEQPRYVIVNILNNKEKLLGLVINGQFKIFIFYGLSHS